MQARFSKILKTFSIIILILNLNFAKSNQSVNIIFDQEIHDYIQDLSSPILKVANIPVSSVNYYVIYNNNINAFVSGGQNIFVHTGLLTNATNSDQVRGVLAHEIGHIYAGHLFRQSMAMKDFTSVTFLATIIGGLALALAGSSAGIESIFVLTTAGLQVDIGRIQYYSRVQESTADQLAVEFLDKTNNTSVGLLEFMKVLSSNDKTDRRFEWALSHPLSIDRVKFLENWVKFSPNSNKLAKHSENQALNNIKAKIEAFSSKNANFQIYTPKQNANFEEHYKYAYSLFFRSEFIKAETITEKLAQNNSNPYVYELLGDIKFILGKYDESETAYLKAISLNKNASYYYIQLAKAQAALNTVDGYKKALENINKASNNTMFSKSPTISRRIALIYSNLNMPYHYKLYLAQAFYEEGNHENASKFAKQAITGFEEDSSEWLKSRDIIALTSL